MHLEDFDYPLPPELVARYPLAERRDSRLLVLRPRGAEPEHRRFEDLPRYLDDGDLLVFNDTRVIAARLRGRKDSGGTVEILVERMLSQHDALAQVRASKSPKAGSRIHLGRDYHALVRAREGEFFRLGFSHAIDEVLDAVGEVPLPPYLERGAESSDRERYQTVYARQKGAVAAPTAGLHFDDLMLQQTRDAGVEHAFITLHVGAGTFQNLRRHAVRDNRLHAERVHVDAAACAAVRAAKERGGRIIAVGTTSVRALEAASAGGALQPYDGETDLFILPGYRFRSVDVMLTNFHLPRSSLLMLVAAFGGTDRVLAAYRDAVRERYRFFSYGDAMLVFPQRLDQDARPA